MEAVSPSPYDPSTWLVATQDHRRANITTWIARHEDNQARLDAVASCLKTLVSVDQGDAVIEVAWELIRQALQQNLWTSRFASLTAFQDTYHFDYIFTRMLTKQGVNAKAQVSIDM